MLQKLSFLVVLAGFLVSSAPVRAQDQQTSLADAARQARKDKDKNAAAPKTVITDDNLAAGASAAPSSNASAGTSAGSGSSKLGDATSPAPSASGKSGSLEEAWARLQATEASLNQLEPLGKAELAQTVLRGNTTDFPNRSDWEDRLYSAKGIYISRSRQLIDAMKQTLANMDSLQSGEQGKITLNDPRVQALTRKSQQIMQLAARTESAFQAVVTEGQNLALQGAPR